MARWPEWMPAIRARWHDARGQALVEYALILALVAVVVVLALGTLGHTINNVMNNVAGNIAH